MPKQIDVHGFFASFWHTGAFMGLSEEAQRRVLLGVAVASAASIHISIAASQFLLGLGVALELLWRRRLTFPPRIWAPIVAFFLLTIVATLLSPDPWAGRPQVRKFYVFLLVPLLYRVFAEQFERRWLLLNSWILVATASGVWGIGQFIAKWRWLRQTGQDFYTGYVGRRITGFESHWMTFGALQLSVLLLLVAQQLFARRALPRWAWLSPLVLSMALLLGWTRSIWLAAAVSLCYLVWAWRPKMLLAAPVVAALAFAIAPAPMRARVESLFVPHGDTDSNRHRAVTSRIGLAMIRAHPWFGIGTEQVSRQYLRYVPPDVQRPLPTGYYGHLHNIYIQYAAERGIPALIAVLWLIGQFLADCVSALRGLPPGRSDARFVLHWAIGSTIATLVGGLFEFNLGDSEVLMMFLATLALAYAAAHTASRAAPAADSQAV